jgi:hypothetical protein
MEYLDIINKEVATKISELARKKVLSAEEVNYYNCLKIWESVTISEILHNISFEVWSSHIKAEYTFYNDDDVLGQSSITIIPIEEFRYNNHGPRDLEKCRSFNSDEVIAIVHLICTVIIENVRTETYLSVNKDPSPQEGDGGFEFDKLYNTKVKLNSDNEFSNEFSVLLTNPVIPYLIRSQYYEESYCISHIKLGDFE